MKKQEKDFYRVVALNKCRDAYPVYKYYTDPEEWSCNGTVLVSCENGVVDVKIFEKDSINVHTLSVWSEDGPVTAKLTEQTSHPERP